MLLMEMNECGDELDELEMMIELVVLFQREREKKCVVLRPLTLTHSLKHTFLFLNQTNC